MNTVRACPEDLFSRWRQGVLSAHEDEQFRSHLRQCRICRQGVAIGQSFDRVLGTARGDDDLAQRIADAAMARRAIVSVRSARDRRSKTRRFLLVAAVVSVASVAAAARPSVRHAWGALTSRFEHRLTARAIHVPIWHARGVEPVTHTNVTTAEVIPVTAEPVVSSVVEANPVHHSLNATRAHSLNASVPVVNAQGLFALANSNRRAGNIQDALAGYADLQRRFPDSVESVVSHVSVGRILLERQHDFAGALAQFDRFLHQSAHPALVEEAMFGRATSLMRLGRTNDERETWRALLTRFPNSVYAERARGRLGTVR